MTALISSSQQPRGQRREVLSAGEAERRFGAYFEIERIAGNTDLSGWPRGFAAYLMTRKAA